jgi:hypothetical protein
MLGFVICLILAGILVSLIGCGYLLSQIERNTRDAALEIRELRLVSRTRVRQAKVSTGVPSEEQKLQKVGRVAMPRRVVFGGDDDSTLNKTLNGLGAEDGEPISG